MSLPIKLSDVVAQLSMVSDDVATYFNHRTGEFVMLPADDTLGFEDEDDFAAAENQNDPDWLDDFDEEFKEQHRLRKQILKSDDYTALPDKFDIHEWQIMNDFCRTQRERIRYELLGLIRGSGAFRRFHNAINGLGLETKWVQFRRQAYEQVARRWLAFNEIEFIDDCQSPIDGWKKHPVASSTGIKPETARLQNEGREFNDGRPRSAAPIDKDDEIKVFISHQNSHCAECDQDLGKKAWITLERDKGALCLSCADLDELIFLPAGDAALTRRSKKYSTLSAVVLKFSKARGRYERQGLSHSSRPRQSVWVKAKSGNAETNVLANAGRNSTKSM